jgi:zinc protease
MESCSGKDIQGTAAKYLKIDHLSALELTNQEMVAVEPEEYQRQLTSAFAPPEAVMTRPLLLKTESTVGTAKAIRDPLIIKDGVTYILHPDPRFSIVSSGIFFNGGRNEENESIAGITHLLFRTVLKGTPDWSAEELAFRFDALANQPRFTCHRDYSGFVFESLPENFTCVWDLLLHCIAECNFPEKEVETEKGKMIATIRRNLDDNFVRPMQLFQRAYFGSHPYGLPENGFEETVQTLNQTKINDWKKNVLNGARAIVVAVGNFEPDSVLASFQKSLQRFPFSTAAGRPREYSGNEAVREIAESRPKKQTAFVLGFPAPSATDPAIYQYEAMQQILSGMGGRLFLNLRSKKSLAYTVYAGTVSSRYAGTFITYIAGESTKESEALNGMWQELEKLKSEPASRAELENAYNALTGGYSLNTQTASSRVFDYLNCYQLGRPIPFLPVYRELARRVTLEDIQRIAQKTFSREKSTVGIVRGTAAKTDAEKVISSGKDYIDGCNSVKL